jgi:hypothetical protein
MKLKYWIWLAAIVILVMAGLVFKNKETGGVNALFFFALLFLGWCFLWFTRAGRR